jgi:hypothetical protein
MHTCHPSYVGGINRRIIVLPNLGKNASPYSKKINKAKKELGM